MSHRNNASYYTVRQSGSPDNREQQLMERVRKLEQQLDMEIAERREEQHQHREEIRYQRDRYQDLEEKFQKEHDAHDRTFERLKRCEAEAKQDKFDLNLEVHLLQNRCSEFMTGQERLEKTVVKQKEEIRNLERAWNKQIDEIEDLLWEVSKLKKTVEEKEVTLKEKEELQEVLETKITELSIENEKKIVEEGRKRPNQYRRKPNRAKRQPATDTEWESTDDSDSGCRFERFFDGGRWRNAADEI